MIKRAGPKARVIWLTNGDGLAPSVGADPKTYARERKAESDRAMEVIGVEKAYHTCLDYSEIEIYDRWADIYASPNRLSTQHGAFFRRMAEEARAAVHAFAPDDAFACAFQGGHPEHDLAHFLCAHALKGYRTSSGKAVPLHHLPEYEFTILVPLRFKPWYKREVMKIRLTDEELETKMAVMECFPSQKDLFRKFERVIDGIGVGARFLGRRLTKEDFFRTETFGPIDPAFDYTASTHCHEFFNYMFERHEGTPIRFDRSVAPVIRYVMESC